MPDDYQFYTIYDRGRQLDFEGVLLGHSSSHKAGKPRWFEVTIYRTRKGTYVVSGHGKSVVVHRPGCTRLRDNGKVGKAASGSVPCEECRPSLTEPVAAERNREWAQVSTDPAAIISRLSLKDSQGISYLPNTSVLALEEAAKVDPQIASAYYAPRRVS